MSYKHISLFIFISLFTSIVIAQENIVPLKSNAVLQSYGKNVASTNTKVSAFSDTLSLPIVDDFSLDGVYPNQSLWCDSNVYINSHFPINPLSVGVATFDGLDKFGNAYKNSSSGISGVADYLTSQPINLFQDDNMNVYLPSDSIFLSFFVQPTGLGESPDSQDSLYVEFYNPNDSSWTWQWGIRGGTTTNFEGYKVVITDTAYFKDGFRFRFVNVGNLTGNLDHWHLDYLILKRNLNLAVDTLRDDIGYVERVNSLLVGHTAIPYSHYKAALNKSDLIVDTVNLRVRNNINALRLISNATDNIYDENGTQIFNNAVSSNNINPNADSTYNFSLGSFVFPDNISGDSAAFTLVDHIGVSAGDLIRDNDTIRYTQEFYDYYAYDDGSAEAGYFLSTAFAEMCMAFDLIKPDTLRGVYIHFSQINDDVSNERFTLKVWKDLGPGVGIKDSVLDFRTDYTPDYENVINGFHYYEFDSLIPVDGRIYIGFQQITTAHLNVGLDLNRNANGKMYFNTQGTWNLSQVQGAWMMRPRFGDTLLFASTPPLNEYKPEFNLYPNPANDKVFIQSDLTNTTDYLVEVFDLPGSLVIRTLFNHSLIDISELQSGIYFVRLINQNTGIYQTKKLIINR